MLYFIVQFIIGIWYQATCVTNIDLCIVCNGLANLDGKNNIKLIKQRLPDNVDEATFVKQRRLTS